MKWDLEGIQHCLMSWGTGPNKLGSHNRWEILYNVFYVLIVGVSPFIPSSSVSKKEMCIVNFPFTKGSSRLWVLSEHDHPDTSNYGLPSFSLRDKEVACMPKGKMSLLTTPEHHSLNVVFDKQGTPWNALPWQEYVSIHQLQQCSHLADHLFLPRPLDKRLPFSCCN